MRFSCIKSHLEHALSYAERFVGKNITLPILGNVLLSADEGGLTVTATNLEHAIEIHVPGDTKRPGKVSVPARIISSLIQGTREEKIELDAKQGNLLIASDSRQSRVNGMSADDFPLIPKIKKVTGFSARADMLSSALQHVLPAVSSSDFKPELGGVLLKARENVLTLAATDTFRLAEEEIAITKGPSAPSSSIAPQRTGQEIARILGEYQEEYVTAALGENQLLVTAGPVRITTRLIEGAFPEYRAIIPSRFETSAFITREELNEAVRSSGIFVSKLQEVTLNFAGGFVEVVSANPEVGEYRTKIKAHITGKDNAISFNYRYLLDGITALEEEELFFGLTDASAPALMRNKSAHSFTYVVMPIRLT